MAAKVSDLEPTTTVGETWWSMCSELDRNVSDYLDRLGSDRTTTPTHVDVSRVVQVLVPIVALFGILGNALNLIVLTRKSLRYTMDHLEKSAHSSLIALAVSDALICVVYAARSAMRDHFVTLYSRHRSLFSLYFDMYHEGLFNVLLISSTWLTVVMAVGRYVAVCKPLHARGFISVCGTRIAIASVFIGSVLFNLPRFWHYEVFSMPCGDLLSPTDRPPNADACASCRYYMKHTGPLYRNSTFVAVYGVACSAVAILFPLPVLTVCNVCLARALRRSRLLQKQYRATMMRCRSVQSTGNEPTSRSGTGSRFGSSGRHQHGNQSSSHHRITPTVIGLIVLFTLLVGPSEMLGLVRHYVITAKQTTMTGYVAYRSAVAITNFLLLVNFAVNFVLYCVVNVQFRRTCTALLTFLCRRCVRRCIGPSRPRRDETAAAAGACSSAAAMARPVAVQLAGDGGSRCYHFASTSANVHKAADDGAELLTL